MLFAATNTTIVLTNSQMILAGTAASMRQMENVHKKRKSSFDGGKEEKNPYQAHNQGCLSEYALCKYLDVFWPGKGELGEADCGEHDARSSTNPYAHLIIYKKDIREKPLKKFYLLTGQNGKYTVRGWYRPIDAEREEWWKEGDHEKPGYWVNQKELRGPWS